MDFDDPELELLAEFEGTPIINVSGVVGASGGTRRRRSFIFRLEQWQVENGVAKNSQLIVRKPVGRDEVDALLQVVQPNESVTFSGHFLAINSFGSPQALLVGDLKAKGQVATPEPRQDPFFGEFTYDQSTGEFSTFSEWNGGRVELRIGEYSVSGFEQGICVAKRLWDEQETWDQQFREKIMKSLFDLKNDSWNDDNEPLSENDFLAMLRLETVFAKSEGSFECFFADNIFDGHAIVLEGNIDEGIVKAGI